MVTTHPLDGTEPSSSAGGRPPALKPEHIAVLHDIVMERAQASLQEIADELHYRCGLRVRWVDAGVFEQMQDRLREQWRVRMGRASTPSAAIIDAQSTRISPQGGESGFDAGKKIKGRKRHLVVDTMGLIIAVSVTAASVQDRDAAAAVVTQACSKSPRLDKLYTDGAYGGKCAHAIEQAHRIRVAVVRHPANGTTGTLHDPKTTPEDVAGMNAGFMVLPMRWVVERTHAWTERWRRTVMHHDRKLDVSAAWVWLAEARMLLNRLAYKG